jgi:hypothetical protein
MVYTISRHGARNALPKTSLLQENAMGPTLLPQGERLCYDAGRCSQVLAAGFAACAVTELHVMLGQDLLSMTPSRMINPHQETLYCCQHAA